MRMTPALIAGKLFALALFTAGAGHAAEIKVLASNALKTALEELGPQFEKATEHKLSFTFNAAVPLKAEIEKGAVFDVAILSTPITDDLVKQGKLVGATRADIARSGAALPSSEVRQDPTSARQKLSSARCSMPNRFVMSSKARRESISRDCSSASVSPTS